MNLLLRAASGDTKKWFSLLQNKGYQIEIEKDHSPYIEIGSIEKLFTLCNDIKTEIIIEPNGEIFYGNEAIMIYDDFIE